MRQGIQTIFGEAGEAACYVFNLGNVAEEYLGHEIEASVVILTAIDNRSVYYNKYDSTDPKNFYVEYPARLLKDLTGVEWEVRHDVAGYVPKVNEYVINRHELKSTGVTYSHFNRANWDSLLKSRTVRLGSIVSTRVCKVKIY